MESFIIKDCALSAIALGVKAQTLTDFRISIAEVPAGCIYYHFWRSRLESHEAKLFYNDFSFWSHFHLHDDILAERLENLNPTEYKNLEGLRGDILEIVDQRLDEHELIPWTKREEAFHFINSNTVVFSTNKILNKPSELVRIFPTLSPSSIFYHYIDGTRRKGEDDFSLWLKDYPELVKKLKTIDPYFISLIDLQKKLSDIFISYFLPEKSDG